MRAYITPYTVANQARMRNPGDSRKARIFIEGKDDVRIVGNLTNPDTTILIPSAGKPNAIGAVRILRADGWRGVFAIVDRDFDLVDGVDVGCSDIAVTDDHDAEMMLLRSAAVEKLLIEFALAEDANRLRNVLLECGRILGYLRWLSLKQDLGLNFNNLEFKEFVDSSTLTVDSRLCLTAVIRNTNGCRWSLGELQTELNRMMTEAHDLWQMCCGHDLVAILAIKLERHLNRPIYPVVVARSIRLAFEFAHFQMTRLFAWMKEWEIRNPEWPVLR